MTIKRCTAVSTCTLLLAAFSGCGSGSGQSPATENTADAFISVVQSTVSSSPDNTEPVATDAIVVTSPQTTEAIPVI